MNRYAIMYASRSAPNYFLLTIFKLSFRYCCKFDLHLKPYPWFLSNAKMTTKAKKPRENSDRTPTNWAFSILTTTTSDTDPSFIIDFEQPGAKYIFNAGENTIRAFSQSKWGLVKTEGVFLTGVRGQTSGGLSCGYSAWPLA